MLKLCRGDTVIDTLRNVFHANIVKIPESRIQPLVIAAAASDRTSFRGAILPLLKKPTGYTNPQVLESKMPSISGTKTRAVSLDLGLDILGNFLQGFGVPSVGLSSAFQGAKKVSFSFNQVIRYFVDVNDLGERMRDSVLDRANPAGSIFFQQGNAYRCCILDSAITSRDFTISVEETSKNDFHIDVPTLQQIVTKANAGMSITESSKLTISFQGDKQLGFAFSCLVATLDQAGKIQSLEPGGDVPLLESARGRDPDTVISHTPDHVLLSRDPVMVPADFSEFAAE